MFPPSADTASKVRVLMNVTLTRWVTCSWSAQERMPPVTPCPEFQGHKVDDGCPTLVGGQMGAAASVTYSLSLWIGPYLKLGLSV